MQRTPAWRSRPRRGAHVAPSAKGYVVTGTDRRGGSAVDFTIECKMLVVACGAVASTGLLLRSEDAFMGAHRSSGALGRHLSPTATTA
ncbi:MAG: hypothetical protein U0235_09820 [Polyangiaceae bacterium]